MYKYKILLIGASGRGKTYSFRNMNKETTGFVNGENKPLPFKGSFKNTIVPNKPVDYINALVSINSRADLDCVVIDSFSSFIDAVLLEARATKTGYEIWSYYNEQIGKFNDAVKKCNKEVFVTAHWDVVVDEVGGTKERKAKVKGNEWQGMIEKDYTITLYTEAKVEFGQDKPKHSFVLYSDGTTSAKCPPDIFGTDVISIDNDSNLVLEKIREFQK